MIDRAYVFLARPWWTLLGKLIRVTGKPSTFFSRMAVRTCLLVWITEIVLGIARRDPWIWAVIDVAAILIGGTWALGLIRKVESSIRAGAMVVVLSMADLATIMFIGVFYFSTGVATAPVLLAPDLLPLRCLLIAVAAFWIPIGHGGGKSAWARFKERARAPKPSLAGAAS